LSNAFFFQIEPDQYLDEDYAQSIRQEVENITTSSGDQSLMQFIRDRIGYADKTTKKKDVLFEKFLFGGEERQKQKK
jgi:2-methylcitrate dehydratase PrpD